MLCGGGRNSGLAPSGEPARKVSPRPLPGALALMVPARPRGDGPAHVFRSQRAGRGPQTLRAQQREGSPCPGSSEGNSCPGGRCWVGGKGGVGSLLCGVWRGPRPQQPVYPANFHFGTQLQPRQVQGRGRGERKPQVGQAARRPPPLSEPRAEPCVRSQPAPIRCLWCPAWPTAHNDRPGGVPSSSGGWRPESTPGSAGRVPPEAGPPGLSSASLSVSSPGRPSG